MTFGRIPSLILSVCLISCTPHAHLEKFDFWSHDRTNGMFFDGGSLAIGSVVYAGGKPIEKGVEGKLKMRREENSSAICLIADDFAMALPKPSGIRDGRAHCGSVQFRISACTAKDNCAGSLVSIAVPRAAKASPLWYSYEPERGVTKISFDPKGLPFNTLILQEQKGPTASGG